jgi:ubiquinone/menaquinone biosynthesis C-methylase UbiE
MSAWDHTSNEHFYDYYAEVAPKPGDTCRFRSIRDVALRVAMRNCLRKRTFDVADIGCGADTQSLVWSELAHRVHALDVNQPLVELARQRVEKEGRAIDFQLGSATQLPWADESMDILSADRTFGTCHGMADMPERVRSRLATRRNYGLCPFQQEFNLPLYSWYPNFLKRYFERLAVTTRPKLANYVKYRRSIGSVFMVCERPCRGMGSCPWTASTS